LGNVRFNQRQPTFIQASCLRARKSIWCTRSAGILGNESRDLGTNLAGGLRTVDSHKVAELRCLMKERLSAILKLLRSFFSLAGKEHFCGRIEVDRQARPGAKPRQDPAVLAPLESRDIAVHAVERKVEQEMSIVQNDVPPCLMAQGQKLSIPFLTQEFDKQCHRPKDLPRRASDYRPSRATGPPFGPLPCFYRGVVFANIGSAGR